MTEWINVKDKPPKFDTWVLCYMAKGIEEGHRIKALKYYEHCWSQSGEHLKIPMFTDVHRSWIAESVTHWMPLPKVPGGSNG